MAPTIKMAEATAPELKEDVIVLGP